jgi:hypothetical protein
MASVNTLDLNSDHEDTEWTLVESGTWKGVSMVVDLKSENVVIQLSTRFSTDQDRWTTTAGMPSVGEYAPSLQMLDLHNSRYLMELHDSVTDLLQLRKMILTRCNRLERLPNSLGRLENLKEV